MFTLLTLFACYWQDKYCDFYKATTMLTKKGKYGLKALVDLARLAPGETAFINHGIILHACCCVTLSSEPDR